MRDVLLLLIVIGFFAAASLYVTGCSALIGSGGDPAGDDGTPSDRSVA